MLFVAYVLVTFILLVDDQFKRQNNSICVSMCVCVPVSIYFIDLNSKRSESTFCMFYCL